ncbi:phage integrase N-terminal SAM-like domain-containing protein [Marinospirillum insulare]|uniref:phage integrase N-terminal SAM-like domain-containing protein n=1 Tax=Marinospirillum insulare TaxID=217169 RepID=UPI0009FD2C71|nr:phage integrase N-terminal SAM-like domain-containing protein [Marinospirillum insulare]
MLKSPFLNSIRMDLRQKGYALKTEKTYLYWIKYFILFHKKQHPQNLGNLEMLKLLTLKTHLHCCGTSTGFFFCCL